MRPLPVWLDKQTRKDIIPEPVIKLQKTKYVYTGKNIFPKVVTDSALHTDIYASSAKKVGRYSVKVNLQGDLYTGTKTLTYDILPKAGGIKSARVNKNNGAASIAWKKVKGVSGYEVQISKSKTFSKGTKHYNAGKNLKKANLTLDTKE